MWNGYNRRLRKRSDESDIQGNCHAKRIYELPIGLDVRRRCYVYPNYTKTSIHREATWA
jgi:hypothetical protein